jgi:hypothetical protein
LVFNGQSLGDAHHGCAGQVGHDGDPHCVDGAQVVFLKKTNHVSLRIFLESHDSRGLGVEVRHEQGDQMIAKNHQIL